MADGITNVKVGRKQAQQFQNVFSEVIPFSLTFEDDSILDGDVYSGGALVDVAGAALGDVVLVFPEIDPVECQFFAAVQAADKVEVTLHNNSGGTVTAFASGVTVNGVVLKFNNELWADPSAW